MSHQPALFTDAQPSVRIEADGAQLLVFTPYAPHAVEQLKAAIPADARKWLPDRRAWAVRPDYGAQVQSLLFSAFGVTAPLPEAHTPAATEVRLLDCRYIGAVKERGGGLESAYGWSNGSWSLIFPKQALQQWFGAETRPGEAPTLYAVLGVRQDADAAALKHAYRRAALQWHPDRCHEPDAAAQFTAIKDAWELLGDPASRARYDAGLFFAANLDADLRRALNQPHWRPPLRCGFILAQGTPSLDRFLVERILQWEEITDAAGRTLVTQWIMGDESPREEWITP